MPALPRTSHFGALARRVRDALARVLPRVLRTQARASAGARKVAWSGGLMLASGLLVACGPGEEAAPEPSRVLKTGTASIGFPNPDGFGEPATTTIEVALYDGNLLPGHESERPDLWLTARQPVERVTLTSDDPAVPISPRLLPTWQLVLPIWLDANRMRSSEGLSLAGELTPQAGMLTIDGFRLGGQRLTQFAIDLGPTQESE